MKDKIKEAFKTIGLGVVILFFCAVIVTRLTYLGIFLISALYLAIHIYYHNMDKGKGKFDSIFFAGVYVAIIILSLHQYSVVTEEIKKDQYLSGQRYGYEEGYVEGRRDAVNAADSITNASYRDGYNDGFSDGYVEAENYYLYEFYS